MKRILSIAAAAMLLSLLVAAPASAAPTFHGTWERATFPEGCPVPDHPVDGNWNVTLLADGRAVVHYNTFEPTHLMSVGGAKLSVPPKLGELWQQDATANGEAFEVSTTWWGSTMTMTLIGEDLTFLLVPYGPCAWGTATGHLGH